jgi:hypothetical protein
MSALTAVVPAWIVKEFRVLVPAWLVALTVIWIMGVAGEPPEPQIAVVVIASVIIGAISVGHEFAYRTLESLFALPASRLRLYVTKTAAAMLLLLLLSLYVIWLPGRENIRLVILLAGVPGLFLAQWLTLRFRGELAGVVFTLALPVVIFVGVNLITTAISDTSVPPTSESIELRWALFSRLLAGICLAATASGWWLFVRIETAERAGNEIGLPEWLRLSRPHDAAEARPRHPLTLLLRKELRLQQLTFVVAVIYLLGYAAIVIARRSMEIYPGPHLLELTYPYVVLATLMIGSLASAEERQMGTLGWQALLPIAFRDQWRVKAAVVLMLTVVLALVVPTLLLTLEPSGTRPPRGWWLSTWPFVVLLSSAALYVSSISASGLRSLLTCFALAVPGWFGLFLLDTLSRLLRASLTPSFAAMSAPIGANERAWWLWLGELSAYTSIVGVAFLILRFARDNHLSANRDWDRIARHLGIILLVIVAAIAWISGIQAYVQAGTRWPLPAR